MYVVYFNKYSLIESNNQNVDSGTDKKYYTPCFNKRIINE